MWVCKLSVKQFVNEIKVELFVNLSHTFLLCICIVPKVYSRLLRRTSMLHIFSFPVMVATVGLSKASTAYDYLLNMNDILSSSAAARQDLPVDHVLGQKAGLPPVGYFLRSFNATALSVQLDDEVAAALEGLTHYRLLPGIFHEGMQYHFDGLATVLKMSVDGRRLRMKSRPFESDAFKTWNSCLFFGTGTGPTLGSHICFQNPGVNLLPLGAGSDAQLWLTIDTSAWGRVDPESLATIDGARVEVGGSFTLNAHPACDPSTRECFVQHPCPGSRSPLSDDVCISLLLPSHNGSAAMGTVRLSHAKLPRPKLIQHSHSPCLTPRFVVSKIDAFTPRNPRNSYHGMLHRLHQQEEDLWMVFERSTNRSVVVASVGRRFVNNHFWNCYEDPDTGDVVVETVPATSEYLDTYFASSLSQPTVPWSKLLTAPLRCRLRATVMKPAGANDTTVECAAMFGEESSLVFDYPTYKCVRATRRLQRR